MPKIRSIHHFVLEISLIQEFHNLTDEDHF